MGEKNGQQFITGGSGDVRIRREGKASEVSIPWGQYLLLMASIGMMFAAGSGSALLMQHWAVWLPVAIGIGWIVVVAARMRDGTARIWALFATTTIGVLWATVGVGLCRDLWIFPQVAWPWQVRLYLIIGLATIVIAPSAWIAYRYAAEIIDPSGPTAPRAPVQRAGVQWPWTGELPSDGSQQLTREEIRELIEERMGRRSTTLRVETVRNGGHNGGRVSPGDGIDLDDIPHGEVVPSIARRWRAGQMRFSRRGLGEVPGLGDTKARQLLEALVEQGFLWYPNGENHPDGAQPTSKGRALLKGVAGK